MEYDDLMLAQDLTPAAWIVERIHDFAGDVGSVIPEGFPAYARLLHPASRSTPEGDIPVSWSEVAAANDRVMHPEVQWANISGVELHEVSPDPDLWRQGPSVGYLPPSYGERLVDLLAPHTSTPERVWFAVWEGWGGLGQSESSASLRRGYRSRGPRAPRRLRRLLGAFRPRPRREPLPAFTFRLPNRGYYLFGGPLRVITTSFDVPSLPASASLWWSEDRAWCVATEIDFAWTYLGGSEACVASVLADREIEALRAEIGHGITHDSDRINQPPRSSSLGS